MRRLMRSSWLIVLLLNFVLAVYFVVSGLGFGMWCVPLAYQHIAEAIQAATPRRMRLAEGSVHSQLPTSIRRVYALTIVHHH